MIRTEGAQWLRQRERPLDTVYPEYRPSMVNGIIDESSYNYQTEALFKDYKY